MTTTSSPPALGVQDQIDLVELARALGLQAHDYHPMAFGPASQCPACLSKPRQRGHCCKPKSKPSAVIRRRQYGPDVWSCHFCGSGQSIDEFVAFHMFAKRHHQLSAPQRKAMVAFIDSLEGIRRPASHRQVAGVSP